MRSFLTATVLALIGVMVLQSVQAGTWYVALSGNNGDGQSWATAYTNVQTAVAAASDGDTVAIRQGLYTLTNAMAYGSAISVSNKILALRGGYEGSGTPGACTNDPARTVLSVKTSGFRVMSVFNCSTGLIEGLTLADAPQPPYGLRGGGLWLRNSTNTVRNCIIRDISSYGTAGIGVCLEKGLAIFEQCVVRGGKATTSYVNDGGGFYNDSGTLVLNSCLIIGNEAARRGDALYQLQGTTRLFNCLIRQNTDIVTNASYAVYVEAGTASVVNCTIEGNAFGGIKRIAGVVAVTNSILWNNGDDVSGAVALVSCDIEDGDSNGVNGCLSADPLFTRGYYLADASPGLNAGSDSAANLGLAGKYAQTGAVDSGAADIGFHYDLPYTAPDLYVANAGSDTYTGASAAQPLKTLTRALALVQPGARINLAAGTYNAGNGELFPLTNAVDAVQLLGTNAAATVIDAGNLQRVLYVRAVGAGSVISNVTICNGRWVGTGAGIMIENSELRVVDCVIRDNYLGSSGSGAGIYIRGGGPVIERCEFRNNRNISNSSAYGGGLYLYSGPLTVLSSAFFGNESYGFGGAALYLNSQAPARLFNCLIRNNTETVSALKAAGILVANGPVSMENCTVEGNSPGGIGREGGVLTVSNSIVWNNGDDASGAVALVSCDIEDGDSNGVNGCLSADPLFTRGYYLGDASPCINAGALTAAGAGLAAAYARTGTVDSGAVDLGYHYPAAFTAPDLYVSAAAGNDANAGTSAASPLKRLTRALGVAQPGARIFVAAGVYGTNNLEVFPLTHAVDGLQLLGTNAALTVVDATNSAGGQRVLVVQNAGSGSTLISNLTFCGGAANAVGAGLYLDGSGIAFADCAIRDNRQKGNVAGSGVYINGGRVTLDRCEFRSNMTASAWGTSGGAVYHAKGFLLMRSCSIIASRASNDGGGLYLGSVEGATLFDCLVVSNTCIGGLSNGIVVAAGSVLLANVTVAWNPTNGLKRTGGSVTVTNSILWNNGDDLLGAVSLAYSDTQNGDNLGTNGCLSADPKFTSGFYLAPDSPCVDAGGDTALAAGLAYRTTRLDGRPDQGVADLGCHYYTTYQPRPAGTVIQVR